MVSEPAKKRLKTSTGNKEENSNEPTRVNVHEPLAQASTDPFLDSDGDDDQSDIPSDTVAALNLLKIEFPKLPGVRYLMVCRITLIGKPVSSLHFQVFHRQLTVPFLQVRPFATRSQLYTVLNDKTLADRELDHLK
jgi:hypothetical protein